jgi:LmbE family N-acetylglucosaminyl deacetylase
MEIHCSGTLLKCKERGDNVTVCNVANGNMGHVVLSPDELRKVRRAEADASAALAGFTATTCDIDDLYVNSADRTQHDKIVEVIRRAKPDFIITHAPNDYMIDHVETSKLVFYASFSASVPHYRPDLGEATPVTPIFYMDNAASMEFEPEFYVDISDVIEKKLEMLACHKSQKEWLDVSQGMDAYLDDMVYRAEYFGKMSGRYRYAEGWIRHHPAGFCADDFNPMLEALKDDAFVNPRFEESLKVEFPA